ncbi:MFS transporter [Nonomuraea glycinis]|uniref:MFS transporter n=1 Tax=Nonomuraea glycinis TaxID=2047744 RepID=A0A918E2Q8_9ACTN|nr:MFS transporter [Nonomuraea glycinis]MCA2175096.1 MFS transporter [Nonomuraea glycinis]GGP00886.1 MFS transporter [Nonomuraea glycinis]
MTTTDVLTGARARWLAVTSVAAGTFTIVTSEMLPVGLLTSIASTLEVSDGTAGLMMSAPGLVAAVSAPVLAITTRRLDRRVTLLALMALLAVANLAGAFAPNYPVMLAARLLTGVSIGGFWAIAAGLGVRLVPERFVGRATSIILAGVSVASVLGVPAATFLSSYAGWRTAFAAMGLVALALLALLATTLPPMPTTPQPQPHPSESPAHTTEQDPRTSESPAHTTETSNPLEDRTDDRLGWLSRPLKVILVLTVLTVSGHFAAYTYLRPFMEQVAHAGPALISTALLLYGAAGVAGNFAAGARAARNPRAVLITLTALMALSMAVLPLTGQTPVVLSLVLLVVWGLGYGGVGVTLQLWIMRSGGGEMGTALFVSAFNVSIALGAFAGGRVVDGVSTSAVMWLGVALTAVSATVAGIWGRSRTTGS